MRYRELGKTGLQVSVVGYGASPLGGVFGNTDEDQGIRTVHTALDLGINYIDVSPYYGNTKAETVLGKALKTVDRDRFYLATKVGRFGPGEYDYSAARVTASVDESLARLNVSHIDVIQCHDVEFSTTDQIVNETLPALWKLRETGKVRFVGITGLPLDLIKAVLDRTDVDTILSFCHYALNDTSLDELIPYLKQKQIGIVSASPMSMGLLTRQGPPAWHPASAEIKQACAEASAYCDSKGIDIAQLAFHYSLAHPDVATTLVGTAKPENLKKNLRWLDEPIDDEILAEVLLILQPIHNQTWQNS
jgi:L-galactose dehydrogenase